MSKTIMYAGCYNRNTWQVAATDPGGIAAFQFDVASGAMSHLGTVTNTDNPSFLAVSRDGGTLYAVNELADRNEGTVTAYRITASGGLSYLNMQPSRGSLPAQLAFDRTERFVLAINYGAGPMPERPNRSLVVYPRAPGGELLAPVAEVSHGGRGLNPARQERPHPHSVTLTPDNRFAVVADLGIDRLMVYRFDAATGALDPHSELSLPPGSGPRHLAFHPRLPYVYVANELTSTVASLAFDADTAAFSLLSMAPTVPQAAIAGNSCSEIKIGPGGRHVYVGNRGHDSVSCLLIDETSGIASLQSTTPSGGKTPRHFEFDPSGAFLAVANQHSDCITVFSLDRKSGDLRQLPATSKVGTPACIAFASIEEP